MKINRPVSGIESNYSDDTEIISTTDLKGILRSANHDFLDVAGYQHDEVIDKTIMSFVIPRCHRRPLPIYGNT